MTSHTTKFTANSKLDETKKFIYAQYDRVRSNPQVQALPEKAKAAAAYALEKGHCAVMKAAPVVEVAAGRAWALVPEPAQAKVLTVVPSKETLQARKQQCLDAWANPKAILNKEKVYSAAEETAKQMQAWTMALALYFALWAYVLLVTALAAVSVKSLALWEKHRPTVEEKWTKLGVPAKATDTAATWAKKGLGLVCTVDTTYLKGKAQTAAHTLYDDVTAKKEGKALPSQADTPATEKAAETLPTETVAEHPLAPTYAKKAGKRTLSPAAVAYTPVTKKDE